ncbi:MAG TPA: DUF881 domain-containing protein [Sporosarcina sp.]|nr:DUF881 domain-containing protein [Sporosarcina sp.]
MRIKITFTIVLLVVGFLSAIQYNTIQKPEERDTRDMWAIRNELSNVKQAQSELLAEISNLDKTIKKYESINEESPRTALRETIEDLYEKAGMTEVNGPGLIINIEPSAEGIALGAEIHQIAPDLLTRLVNEINRVKWKALEIDGKRYTTFSSIRDINGYTTVNGLNVSTPPFTMKVAMESFEDAEKVYSILHASTIHDEFFLDDLNLTIQEPTEDVYIKGWKEEVKNKYLKELSKGE